MAQRYATPQGAIPRESASAFVISADGGDARSLTEFVALAATLVGPFVARIKAGTYTESVTLPANCTLIGEGRVVIAGTLTLTSSALLSARLVNLEIAPAAGNGISADFSAAALVNSPVELYNVRVTVLLASTAILASNVQIEADHLDLVVATGVGISLEPSDGAGEETVLRGGRIRVAVSGAGIALRNIVNAVADNRVKVEVDDLTLDLTNGATGCRHDAAGTQVEASQGNGFDIGVLRIRGEGAAINTFFQPTAASQHRIGRVVGKVVSDILFNCDAGDTVVELIDLPDDGLARDTFQIALLGGGNLTILGGVVAGGSSDLFVFDAAGSDLTVKNFRVPSVVDGARIIDSGAALTNATVVLFEDCFLSADSDPTGAEDEIIECLGAGVSAPSFTFRRCRIEALTAVSAGAHAITLLNADLTLEDTTVRQADSGFDCLEFGASTFASAFEWVGSCVFDQATGGAGRALTVADDAQNTLVETGLLQIVRCTPAEQLATGAGQITTVNTSLVNRAGRHAVASGHLATWVAADFIIGHTGIPVASAYPGLHIVTQAAVVLIGAAGNETTNDATIANTDTTQTALTAAVGADVGAGTQDGFTLALTPAQGILVGPGQGVTVVVTTAGGASTDNHLSIQ